MMFEGKVIAVTGAASGIGLSSARLLRAMGAKVIGIDKVLPSGSDVNEFHQADLADPASIDMLVERLPGGLNGLCNAAGLPPTSAAPEVLSVNVVGLKRLTLRLVDSMADAASIVNLSSLAGMGWQESVEAIKAFHDVDFGEVEHFCEEFSIGTPRSYFFSKEYLTAWTFLNRWTWRSRGIRMNCVSPGPVETPIFKDFVATLGARVQEDMAVMDRVATTDDIAPIIAFLLSDGSRWLRGANIAADGGMSAYLAAQKSGLLPDAPAG